MTISEIYHFISSRCEDGYALVDDRSGLPLIERDAVKNSGAGIFTVRFRLPSDKLGALGRVARLVCEDVGSDMHLYAAEKKEFGIPFHECVWVIDPRQLTERQNQQQHL